jgi:hypothetical protein
LKNINEDIDPIINPLFQTYYNKSKIPKDIYDNIKKYAPEYTHIVMDDDDIIKFLKKYYNDNVLYTFNHLKSGAHKADLARYCILYIYGGLYMDIKTELTKPLKEVFNKGNIFYTVKSIMDGTFYQGIIKTPRNNPIFLSLIDYIVKTKNPYNYLDFTKDMYVQISKDINGGIKNGYNKSISGYNDYYIFLEKCSSTDSSMCYDGFDRYNKCCFIWDRNVPVIKSRRSTYPWK